MTKQWNAIDNGTVVYHAQLHVEMQFPGRNYSACWQFVVVYVKSRKSYAIPLGQDDIVELTWHIASSPEIYISISAQHGEMCFHTWTTPRARRVWIFHWTLRIQAYFSRIPWLIWFGLAPHRCHGDNKMCSQIGRVHRGAANAGMIRNHDKCNR